MGTERGKRGSPKTEYNNTKNKTGPTGESDDSLQNPKSDIVNGVSVSSAFFDINSTTEKPKKSQFSFFMKFVLFCFMLPTILLASQASTPVNNSALLSDLQGAMPITSNLLSRLQLFNMKKLLFSFPVSNTLSEVFFSSRAVSSSESFALRYKDSNLILSSKGQTLPLLVMTAEPDHERDGYFFLSVEGEDDKCIMQSKRKLSFRRPTLKVAKKCRQEKRKK